MRALWIENGQAVLRDLPRPRPAAGEALVRVVRAGVCNTDLELLAGYYGFAGVPGHEFVGVVEEGPDGLRGARVVADINLDCGECPSCRRGLRTHCERRSTLGIAGRAGAFAEYLAMPVANLYRVPEAVSDDAATFAEPLAAALRIRHQVPVAPGDRVLVLGAGKLGQLVARSLAPTGCDLAVAVRHEAAVPPLARHRIATLASDRLPSRAFDLVVECTGAAAGLTLALAAVRPRGTVVLKSTYAGAIELPAGSLAVDEVTLVGSRCGSLAEAVELLASGFEVADLVVARYPLSRATEALAHAARPGVLKILLTPDAEQDPPP